MKKQRKKRADDLLKLLGQAHDQIVQSVRSGNLAEAGEILEDCQNAAISIGTAIDEEEGEGTDTVRLLEEYCELVYQLHEAVFQEKAISAEDVRAALDKRFKNIGNAYDRDVPLQKEVVFLPYKASMWDSLESVWETYRKDARWNAVVVPIPYFDKNPDGTLKEFHYEGDQFPEYVPIVSYHNYNLQEIHPDRIYIHNPYDDCNIVTTVHPDYYASRIKKYTDKLIYIPYFVLTEYDPNNPASVASMAHFAQVPGVVHADEVIVQSENMKKCYVEALVRLTGEKTRTYWEGKIKGTGSPKLQKAARIREQAYDYPEDWLRKIMKKDGRKKRVIFYNTSLTAFLRDGDAMIDKIQDVVNVFRGYREETVLLWRPHPLLEATIRAMRPALWGRYRSFVEDFLEEEIGIFDDSADLYRAISVSDAYYGDQSSVVQLFTTAGIPAMIQNVDIREQRQAKW